MSAIILDGQLKSALCAVRALGEVGIHTCVGAERKTGMALHSKYTRETFLYPSPYSDPDGFLDAVRDQALILGDLPVVYAMSDATYLALLRMREKWAAYMRLYVPEDTALDIAFNKAATYSLARMLHVPAVPTYLPESDEMLKTLAATLSYPAVVKPRRSVSFHAGRGIFGSATFVHSKEVLQEKFFDLKNCLGEPPIVQPLIRGEEYGVECISQKGIMHGTVVHHRIRSLSPTGGASVVKETVSEGLLMQSLTEYSRTLIEKLSWTGPIMVEWKVDSDTREPLLMEINGRFWGSLPMSVQAGVNLPLLYYKMMREESFETLDVTPKPGTVTGHFLGDVLHLLRVLFARDAMRPHLYPKRVTALKQFLQAAFIMHDDVWSLRDPKPAFFEVIDIIQKTWKSAE